MSKNLSDEIFENFLEIIANDKDIDKDLGLEIYKSLYSNSSSKEEIMRILKKETDPQ